MKTAHLLKLELAESLKGVWVKHSTVVRRLAMPLTTNQKRMLQYIEDQGPFTVEQARRFDWRILAGLLSRERVAFVDGKLETTR